MHVSEGLFRFMLFKYIKIFLQFNKINGVSLKCVASGMVPKFREKSFVFFNLNLFQVLNKHKDCSEQPDSKLLRGTTKQFAGSRPKNSSPKKEDTKSSYILSHNFRKTPYCQRTCNLFSSTEVSLFLLRK